MATITTSAEWIHAILAYPAEGPVSKMLTSDQVRHSAADPDLLPSKTLSLPDQLKCLIIISI